MPGARPLAAPLWKGLLAVAGPAGLTPVAMAAPRHLTSSSAVPCTLWARGGDRLPGGQLRRESGSMHNLHRHGAGTGGIARGHALKEGVQGAPPV